MRHFDQRPKSQSSLSFFPLIFNKSSFFLYFNRFLIPENWRKNTCYKILRKDINVERDIIQLVSYMYRVCHGKLFYLALQKALNRIFLFISSRILLNILGWTRRLFRGLFLFMYSSNVFIQITLKAKVAWTQRAFKGLFLSMYSIHMLGKKTLLSKLGWTHRAHKNNWALF